MRMTLNEIAYILGGEINGAEVNCPGPGHSSRDRSMSVKITDNGKLLVRTRSPSDSNDYCYSYVLNKLGLDSHDRFDPPAYQQDNIDDEERVRSALALWDESEGPHETIIERYLRSRCLELPNGVANRVIRYHRRCPFGEGKRHRVMMALMRDVITNEPRAIHRTALTHRGEKIDRKMLGPTKGTAIKFDSDKAVMRAGQLIIGEGIETCLSMRPLGYDQPVWALASAGAIASFPVIPGIRKVILLEENDAASRKVVNVCAERWSKAGREVKIVTTKIGSDMNDVLQAMECRHE
jgi:Toprim domain-containing protein